LVILGGPGAGRGTQSERLGDRLKLLWISTGDILRAAIAPGATDPNLTQLGQQAQVYVERGELVPDEVMIQFIRLRLLQADAASGWILDGYPRTAFQAEELDFLLEDLGQRLNKAIYLDVPDEILRSRSIARGLLDDQPDAVQRRIDLFHARTQPLLEYYELRDRLLRINGNQTIEQVQQEIITQLGPARQT
jgi:adenylate kinase